MCDATGPARRGRVSFLLGCMVSKTTRVRYGDGSRGVAFTGAFSIKHSCYYQ